MTEEKTTYYYISWTDTRTGQSDYGELTVSKELADAWVEWANIEYPHISHMAYHFESDKELINSL